MRFLTLSFLLILAFTSVNAQGVIYFQNPKTFEYGPRVGFSTAMVNPEDRRDFGNSQVRLGIVAGLFGRYQLNERWSIQGDLTYAERGGNFKEADDLKLAYLDVPLTLAFNVRFKIKETPLTFDIFGGLQPSFLLNAEAAQVDVTENFKSTTFDLVLGSGFPIKRFLFYATTKIALTNLEDSSLFEGSNSLKGFSTEWTVSYRLNGVSE